MSEANLSLAPAPESASAARRFVTQTLSDWGHRDVVDVSALLVSELVTNALLHARTELSLTVRLVAGRVRIEVRDGLSRLPGRKRYSPESGTGRGLFLVDELSAAWGAEQAAGGKLVWCEIDLGQEASGGQHGQSRLQRGSRTSRAVVDDAGSSRDVVARAA